MVFDVLADSAARASKQTLKRRVLGRALRVRPGAPVEEVDVPEQVADLRLVVAGNDDLDALPSVASVEAPEV